MKLLDIFSYSLQSLKHRQMRSWLTILGIVIGIASVVALLTIGEGFNAETLEFGDLMVQGVVDPTKVVRQALQNAESISGLLLMTEALVAEVPEKDHGFWYFGQGPNGATVADFFEAREA